MNVFLKRLVFIASILALCAHGLWAKDLYVSANGKGRQATKEAPAKDLGNIIELLEAGDVVHIAGGTYVGKGGNGSDEIIVPVSIIGGYDESFSSRDPWGKNRTIFSGDVSTKNYQGGPRLFINLSKWKDTKDSQVLIDGIIVDHGERNNYATVDQLKIIRMASPKEGKNPTPETGGIVVWIPGTLNNDTAGFKVGVKNCVIVNTAPTQGSLTVRAGKNGQIDIKNNIIINNTGVGIFLSSAFHGSERFPRFTVENNSVLFTWKYDPIASSFSGVSLQIDSDLEAAVSKNIFGFADRIGISKSGKQKFSLKDNIILTNLDADLYEAAFDAKIALDAMEDESETMSLDSSGNRSEKLKLSLSPAWLKNWSSRTIIDRNAKEADMKVQQTKANELRSMLGLPLQAGNLPAADGPVWLNRLSLDDALSAVSASAGGTGALKP